MLKLGFLEGFVSMVKLILNRVEAVININGQLLLTFSIQRMVDQRCPMGSYIFLIMGFYIFLIMEDALNKHISHAQ